MVSKACLVGAYQTKLEAIARTEGVTLTVIVPATWADRAGTVRLERVHVSGYDLLVEPIRFNGRYHLHYYPTLARQLARLQPDILHVDEEPYNLATWLALRHARQREIKALFFSWQNILRRYPFPFSWFEHQVLRWADHAIMGNRAAVKVWRQKGYAGPCAVIPQFGVCPRLFKPGGPLPTDEPFTFGAANRRLVAAKGLHVLLEAAAGLRGDWRLRLTGEGPERVRLEALAYSLGIAQRVIFEGPIGSTAMPAFLRRLHALALPSLTTPAWKEQFGRVLIEAMACAVPVVGSDSGEIPHVIGEAGLVVPEGDAEALRRALQSLMDDPARRADLAAAGRARALAHYTQDQVAAQTVAVYRQMMSET
jgi:glycosyltransferase involved in cell wall biosynthesis